MNLGAAINSNDAKEIESVAHKIKGASGQFNAHSMSEIAARMEEEAKAGKNKNQASEKFNALKNIFQEIKIALNKEIR
ncbi:MAG TPA: Hpt domain-containing protein [Gammaproteobacteria bacterium]|nr:Hpt domain-containing protein [Gammaproteobacteria bacterium]